MDTHTHTQRYVSVHIQIDMHVPILRVLPYHMHTGIIRTLLTVNT